MSRTNEPRSPRQALTVLWTVSLVAAALLTAASYWPAQSFGGGDGVVAMLLGVGVTGIISLIAAVPPSLKITEGGRELASAILLGLGARFLLTLFAVLAALLMASGNKALLVWIGIAHVALLTVDTVALVYVMKPAFLRKESA